MNTFITILYLVVFPIFFVNCSPFKSSKCSDLQDASDQHESRLMYNCYGYKILLTGLKRYQHRTLTFMSLAGDEAIIKVKDLPEIETDPEVTAYELVLTSVDVEKMKTFEDVLNAMKVPIDRLYEVTVQMCQNFQIEHIKGLKNLWKINLIMLPQLTTMNELNKMFPELRSLMLHDVGLEQVPDLKGLNYLEEFSMDSHNIKDIPDKYFSDNLRLRTISIGNNLKRNIHVLPKNVFQGLNELTSLTIDDNADDLPSFAGLNSMRELIIESSINPKAITTATFKDMVHLSSLSLTLSGITTLASTSFKHNSMLEHLDLSHNSIENLPNELFISNTKLKYIDFSHNKISFFNDSMLPPSIKFLRLMSNPIVIYQPSTYLASLTALDLMDTQLSGEWKLKIFADTYPSLSLFDLADNQIRKFVIDRDVVLKSDELNIDLSQNIIEAVELKFEGNDDHIIENMTSDIILHLNKNPLKCDCGLKSLVTHLRSSNEKKIHLFGDVRCSVPQGKTLLNINPEDMTC